MNKDKEYILCAAVWVKNTDNNPTKVSNIDNGFVVIGHRHWNCFSLIASHYKFNIEQKGYPDYYFKIKKIEGFLTSKNRFVDREEGAKIAIQAGQIKTTEFEGRLHSEDLY